MEGAYSKKIQQFNGNRYWYYLMVFIVTLISSCSISHKIETQTKTILLSDPIINTGHIGISIFEPASNKYWYQLNGDKYFIPASDTKLFTAYAAMKYLGDSLIGLKYQQSDSTLEIYPCGDPSFLHPDFKQQPVFDFLNRQHKIIYHPQRFVHTIGMGWAWDDYLEKYMVQRSELPMYGNLIRIIKKDSLLSVNPSSIHVEFIKNREGFFKDTMHYAERRWNTNDLLVAAANKDSLKENYEIPLVADWQNMVTFLQDTLHQKIRISDRLDIDSNKIAGDNLKIIFSQPTDSLLKPMLFNSDNFFAEQCLLMVSNKQLGFMGVGEIIDTLLKSCFKDIPQKPRWVDGSGLSRYNLFTPASFVYVLAKMKTEFGEDRLKRILPTGGEGTLKNYYLQDANFVFAKTGSMSNQATISGLLYTRKGKLLLFSILVNQFIGSGTSVRHTVEKYLEDIRAKY